MDSKKKQENEKYTANCEKWMIHQGLGEWDLQQQKKNENIIGKKSTTKADDMYAFEIIYYITARNQP